MGTKVYTPSRLGVCLLRALAIRFAIVFETAVAMCRAPNMTADLTATNLVSGGGGRGGVVLIENPFQGEN